MLGFWACVCALRLCGFASDPRDIRRLGSHLRPGGCLHSQRKPRLQPAVLWKQHIAALAESTAAACAPVSDRAQRAASATTRGAVIAGCCKFDFLYTHTHTLSLCLPCFISVYELGLMLRWWSGLVKLSCSLC